MIREADIYFLENIISHKEFEKEESDKYTAVLLKVTKKSSLRNLEDNHEFITTEITPEQLNYFIEGQHIHYNKQIFENANGTSIAKRNIYYNNFYRGRLIKLNRTKTIELKPFIDPIVFSYHINVGHGNCTIIVIKDHQEIKLWMIDCSNFDYLNKQNYNTNIDSCFNHISNKFKLDNIKVDKFFLTHTHYDHYSGIYSLINNKLIDSETTFFINLHYSMPSENYNRLLRKLLQIKPLIIEPLSTFGNQNIEIWRPHERTIRTRSINYLGQRNVQVEPKPNNSSVVYHLNFAGLSILLPGDIEKDGWNKIQHCKSYLNGSNYFAISHHGSLNGHLRNICPAKRSIQNLSDCISLHSTPILMGRNGAYRGIYSTQVISNFSEIVYSEKDDKNKPSKYLEINWQTNNKNWY